MSMTDTLSSSVESSFGDAFVDVTIENNSLPNKNKNVKNKAIDCRRRL
jgi:hypothetical protein